MADGVDSDQFAAGVGVDPPACGVHLDAFGSAGDVYRRHGGGRRRGAVGDGEDLDAGRRRAGLGHPQVPGGLDVAHIVRFRGRGHGGDDLAVRGVDHADPLAVPVGKEEQPAALVSRGHVALDEPDRGRGVGIDQVEPALPGWDEHLAEPRRVRDVVEVDPACGAGQLDHPGAGRRGVPGPPTAARSDEHGLRSRPEFGAYLLRRHGWDNGRVDARKASRCVPRAASRPRSTRETPTPSSFAASATSRPWVLRDGHVNVRVGDHAGDLRAVIDRSAACQRARRVMVQALIRRSNALTS